MKPTLFAAMALTALVAAPIAAHAQAVCKDKGNPAAKELDALPADRTAEFNRALAALTQPATVAKARAADACVRTPPMHGDDHDAFPRLYYETNKGVAFLAPVPLKSASGTKIYYAVVKSWGSGAVRIDGLFDAVPTDELFARVAYYFDDGGFEPLGVDATGALIDPNNYIGFGLAAAAERATKPVPPPKPPAKLD